MIFDMVASKTYLVMYNETTIIKYMGVFGIDKMNDNKKSLLISVCTTCKYLWHIKKGTWQTILLIVKQIYLLHSDTMTYLDLVENVLQHYRQFLWIIIQIIVFAMGERSTTCNRTRQQ